MVSMLEWGGCALGILGAALLATNSPASKWGWVAFLGSNGLWIAFGLVNGTWGLVVMQLAFTATSMLGVRNWFFRPAATPGDDLDRALEPIAGDAPRASMGRGA